MRTGSETNIQSGTHFFLAALYTGSDAVSKDGAQISGRLRSCGFLMDVYSHVNALIVFGSRGMPILQCLLLKGVLGPRQAMYSQPQE